MILKANAKINLTLDIVGVKENGYHLIDSIFQSITLYDEIEITEAEDLSVAFIGADVDATKSIAYKAATDFFDYTGITKKVRITINSHIPTSSGMGGGSSDAAGVLVGLNKFFGANLSDNELIDIGSEIGADVPFCIIGGTARVKGIGEVIEPIKSINTLDLVIIKNGEKLSTADMYNKLDSIPYATPSTEKMVSAIASGNNQEIINNISNAFGNVFDYEFEKKLLLDLGAIAVGISGSGPSVFGVFPDYEASALAFTALRELNFNVFSAKTADYGIKFE